MAQWNGQGGLSCDKCDEMQLVEQGLESCETCRKPRPLEANYQALELYNFGPVTPIPMTEGLVLLNLNAVEFLFKVYNISHEEQRGLLEKIAIYHNTLYNKKSVKKEGDIEGKES